MNNKLTVEWYAAMMHHYSEMYYKLSICEKEANKEDQEFLNDIALKMDKISDDVLHIIQELDPICKKYNLW